MWNFVRLWVIFGDIALIAANAVLIWNYPSHLLTWIMLVLSYCAWVGSGGYFAWKRFTPADDPNRRPH